MATVRDGDKPFDVFSGVVMPNYFARDARSLITARPQLRRAGSRQAPLVAIVNEALVRQHWPATPQPDPSAPRSRSTGIDGQTTETAADRRRIDATLGAAAATRASRPGVLRAVRADARSRAMNLVVRTRDPVRPADLEPPSARRWRPSTPTQIVDRFTPLADIARCARRHVAVRGLAARVRSPGWRCCSPPIGLAASIGVGRRAAHARNRRAHGARREARAGDRPRSCGRGLRSTAIGLDPRPCRRRGLDAAPRELALRRDAARSRRRSRGPPPACSPSRRSPATCPRAARRASIRWSTLKAE